MNILLPVHSQVPKADPQNVFVYGTLKKGYGNHERHLKNAKFLGQAQIEGIMFHLGGFPAINLGEKYTRIVGEVYQCGWEDILSMDQLEGVDNGFYSRIEIAVFPYKKAWTYVFSHEKAGRERWIIPSGIWRGPETTKVAWGGWGKGALVGAFQTNREDSSILVGPSNKTEFRLVRNQAYGTYNLVRDSTGEVLGTYRNLGEITKGEKGERTVLSLPSRTTNAAEEVKRSIYRHASEDGPNYDPPAKQTVLPSSTPTYITDAMKKVEDEPPAARHLGVSVREA